MFITPMKTITGLSELSPIQATQTVGEATVPFKGLFQDALQNVIETDQKSTENLIQLATGQSDDLHNLTIESTKAQISLQLLVQLRNKALEAYTEVMRVNL